MGHHVRFGVVIECVPNVSEGRDGRVVEQMARACGASLLDVHRDADHHRSVFTLAGPAAGDAPAALRSLARVVATNVDLRRHVGIHPRRGALDVAPFVALDGEEAPARDAARAFAEWWWDEHRVPSAYYGSLAPDRRSLPALRRDPSLDVGDGAHPALGITAVGVRPPMVALNCVLRAGGVEAARSIAAAVRESSGGLVGVRALGFALASSGWSQVSMNLVDLEATGVEVAVGAVQAAARARGDEVRGVEIVGLVPASEAERWSADFVAEAGVDRAATIEGRLSEHSLNRT